jgi:hypothetical protein
MIGSGEAGYHSILALHTARHPYRGRNRLEAEVRDFLRRSAGLAPDARLVSEGGLAGLTASHIRNAAMLVNLIGEDITTLYR